MSADQGGDDGGRIPDLPSLRRESKWETVYAYLYLTLIVVGPIAAVAVLLWSGYIRTDVTIAVNADVGFAVELLVTGVVVVVLFWTLIQVARVAGVEFVNRSIEAVATIADNYERPSNRRPDDEPEE